MNIFLKMKKKMLAILQTMILVLFSILIPKIDVFASTYSAKSTFTYNYLNNPYKFIYREGDSDSLLPSNYVFQEDALDEVIIQCFKGLNLSFASENASSFLDVALGITQDTLNGLFGMWQNALIATGILTDLVGITNGETYIFNYEFTGRDPLYPGHDDYGEAFGFHFRGLGFESIDLVLDSSGHLYGSSTIGNYTPAPETEEISQWSIHQHDSDDIWYVPSGSSSQYQNFKAPYIEGNNLIFYVYDSSGNEKKCEYRSFENCVCVYKPWNSIGNSLTPGFFGFVDFTSGASFSVSNRLYIDGVKWSSGLQSSEMWTTYKNHNNDRGYAIFYLFSDIGSDVVLPMYKLPAYNSTRISFSQGNTSRIISGLPVYETCDLLYLQKVSLTPAPNVPSIPVDVPIPIPDLPEDPTDFDPEPDSDPDPEPVPPVPPIVSGNDDLWPDMNEIFNTESEMDSFLTPLSNFEFTSLANLTDEFSASIVWVSTIMMSLYNGSEYSVLFSILAIFFIACALLGIYKWWSS